MMHSGTITIHCSHQLVSSRTSTFSHTSQLIDTNCSLGILRGMANVQGFLDAFFEVYSLTPTKFIRYIAPHLYQKKKQAWFPTPNPILGRLDSAKMSMSARTRECELPRPLSSSPVSSPIRRFRDDDPRSTEAAGQLVVRECIALLHSHHDLTVVSAHSYRKADLSLTVRHGGRRPKLLEILRFIQTQRRSYTDNESRLLP